MAKPIDPAMKAKKPICGGGHLLGDRDRRQREARNEVAGQVGGAKCAERAEDRPARHGTVRGGVHHRWVAPLPPIAGIFPQSWAKGQRRMGQRQRVTSGAP